MSQPQTAEAVDLRPAAAGAPKPDLDPYQALSIPSALGLALGLASALAFAGPLLWPVPLFAIGVCLFALWQINRYEPSLTGTALARTGLVLAICFGLGAVLHAGLHRLLVARESREVGDLWFDYLRTGELHKAHQLTLDPAARLPALSDLPAAYAEIPSLAAEYEDFVAGKLIRALRNLPRDARVRRYEMERFDSRGRHERVQVVYAVTFVEKGRPKTFFVQLVLHRTNDATTGDIAWQVIPAPIAYRPKAFGPAGATATVPGHRRPPA
jgi:hypothetical protein